MAPGGRGHSHFFSVPPSHSPILPLASYLLVSSTISVYDANLSISIFLCSAVSLPRTRPGVTSVVSTGLCCSLLLSLSRHSVFLQLPQPEFLVPSCIAVVAHDSEPILTTPAATLLFFCFSLFIYLPLFQLFPCICAPSLGPRDTLLHHISLCSRAPAVQCETALNYLYAHTHKTHRS
ncbi:hypothetical protein F5Y03DRAFT_42530 [Xylaria venustula]|nr:hypothetical protein F5Y03DRAFT_42530 [Xylaria venustula]